MVSTFDKQDIPWRQRLDLLLRANYWDGTKQVLGIQVVFGHKFGIAR